MLHEFLRDNQAAILAMAEKKAGVLIGLSTDANELSGGLPIFYQQLLAMLQLGQAGIDRSRIEPAPAAYEVGAAGSSARSDIAEVIKAAKIYGEESLRRGYALSEVVLAYGSLCQSITELASLKKITITPAEFGAFDNYLGVAIAGAVNGFVTLQNNQNDSRAVERLNVFTLEIRNALALVNQSLELVRDTAEYNGDAGQALRCGLKRLEEILDQPRLNIQGLSSDSKT